PSLPRIENTSDRTHHLFPFAGFGGEARAAGTRQLVIARPAIVVRAAPLGRDEPRPLQALQRWIQRPVIDQEDVFGTALNRRRNAVAMARPEDKSLGEERVERSLEELNTIGSGHTGRGTTSPLGACLLETAPSGQLFGDR